MARGRMITNLITRDKSISRLSDDTSRLAFTWLVTFADCEGRVFGDPALIRSTLFPRRDDIDIERMTRYVTEWAEAGIIVWYEYDDDQWIWFPKFDKNQPGLRKEREPASEIPAYNPDTCRIIAGCMPEDCPVKRMEEKGMEWKEEWKGSEENAGAAPAPETFTPSTAANFQAERTWQQVTGQMTMPARARDEATAMIMGLSMRYPWGAELESLLRPYWESWCNHKTKDNRPYPRTSAGWLEWAVAGQIPENGNGAGAPATSKHDAAMAEFQAKLKRIEAANGK